MTNTPDLTDRVELASGAFLNLREPDPAHISVDDIAHGLSMTCRFGGQCSRFYSVAEHAILVSVRLEATGHDVQTQLVGLHHDDSEAFITDVPRPAKPMLPDYRDLESRLQVACFLAAGLEDANWFSSEVKDADDWALAQEAYALMPSRGQYWLLRAEADQKPRWLGSQPSVAKARWLERHERLVSMIKT